MHSYTVWKSFELPNGSIETLECRVNIDDGAIKLLSQDVYLAIMQKMRQEAIQRLKEVAVGRNLIDAD